MESAAQRLLRAREALRAAESGSGLIRIPPLGEGADGGGRVLHVDGGYAELIDALIRLLPSGGWAGLLNLRDFGWEAAARAGLELERVLAIPDPKEQGAGVAALLVDAVDLVCIGGDLLNPRERRTLAAKARSRRCTLLLDTPWPGISRPCGPARLKEAAS